MSEKQSAISGQPSALDELHRVIGYWKAQQNNPSTAKLTISGETLKRAAAELADKDKQLDSLRDALAIDDKEIERLRAERDEYVIHLETARIAMERYQEYRKMNTLNFQLEKADSYIRDIAAALAQEPKS